MAANSPSHRVDKVMLTYQSFSVREGYRYLIGTNTSTVRTSRTTVVATVPISQHDDVEGHDVPVRREPEEEVVVGLRVGAAELVAGRQQRDGRDDAAGGAVREVPVGPQQHHRREGVGDVVDDVVEQGAVEVRDDRLDVEAPGQHAVGAVDDHRGQEQPQDHLDAPSYEKCTISSASAIPEAV